MAEMMAVKLDREYSQWKLAKKLQQQFTKDTQGFSAGARRIASNDAENSFGRWLSALQFYGRQQQLTTSCEYPLFPRKGLSDATCKQEFILLLKNRCKGMSINQATDIVSRLYNVVIEFLDREPHDEADSMEVNYEESEKGGCVIVCEFRSVVCPLIRFLVDKHGLMETALVCLRFDPLSRFMGGESGLSITAFNALYEIGGATLEGFASPLNSRLVGSKFCSLFPDTDSAFGSLGNFFNIKLSDHPGGWVLNPPFVEPVMEATASRVLDTLQKAEPGTFWFYILFPMWDDNAGWQQLDRSEWKVERLDLKKSDRYILQDCYGQVVRPHQPQCIFVLGELPAGVGLTKLRERIVCSDEQQVKKDWVLRCT